VTLHRKIFYDEVKEKLIIITANIVFKQGSNYPSNPMQIPTDATQFIFKILEPESNMLTQMQMPFENCLSQQ
jgi:hypothetical protein